MLSQSQSQNLAPAVAVSTQPDAAAAETTIRVLLIEDMREVREGLTMLINGTPGFRCVSSHRTMEDALARLGVQGSPPPDIILTDIGLPGMSGIEGIGILRERLPAVPILTLTVYDNDDNVFNALCAGA
ncbi:MAG: response regulator transcription factor, partial [Acidobacteriota bacterium]|nr:response regulator transcription factor [Acidobacteriota bacterium]